MTVRQLREELQALEQQGLEDHAVCGYEGDGDIYFEYQALRVREDLAYVRYGPGEQEDLRGRSCVSRQGGVVVLEDWTPAA